MGVLPIVSVTVHPDGAVVTRRGSAKGTDGRLRIANLPLLLEPDSLRIRVQGTDLVSGHLDLDLPFQRRTEATALQVELHRASQRAHRLEVELDHARSMRSFLMDLTPEFDGDAPPVTAVHLRAWSHLDAALTPWSTDVASTIRALEVEHEQNEFERARLRQALELTSTESHWRRWAPTHQLDLAVATDATAEIEVSYSIPGARWLPTYTLDMTRDLRHGHLTLRALVSQQTGEDWSDIDVVLSTAARSRVTDVPTLSALRLGTRSKPRRSGFRELPTDLDSLFPSSPPKPALKRKRKLKKPQPAKSSPPPPPMPAPQMAALSFEDDLDMPEVEELEAIAFSSAAPAPPQRSRSRASAPRGFGGAPPAADKRRRAPRSRKEAPTQRAEAVPDALDYASLRLHGAAAGHGKRGRLHRPSAAEDLESRGLPPTGIQRWRDSIRRQVEQTHHVRDRPLPPHHVLPGPVEGRDVVYRTSGRATLPSDGQNHAITLFSHSVTLKLRYLAVPSERTDVFRIVEATLERIGTLLPGPLEATIDGALELVAPFKGAAGDRSLSFGMGIEKGLKLTRNVRYDEASAGMLGGSRRFSTHIVHEVASALSHDVTVELLERVPVPTADGGPKFDVTESSPNAEPYKGETDTPPLKGGRRQHLGVPAGNVATARLHYEVVLSNREELQGGDRRG